MDGTEVIGPRDSFVQEIAQKVTLGIGLQTPQLYTFLVPYVWLCSSDVILYMISDKITIRSSLHRYMSKITWPPLDRNSVSAL